MLTILVAHHGEGKAFIKRYHMKPDRADNSNRRFIGDGICLRILGQGEEQATRSLVKELSRQTVSKNYRWLNFGVAGSSEFLVSDIVEVTALHAEGREPEQGYTLEHRGLASATDCRSVKKPREHYPETGVLDMEAYWIATEFASRAMLTNLAVVKLVVDSPAAPCSQLTPALLNHHLIAAESALTAISDRLIISA